MLLITVSIIAFSVSAGALALEALSSRKVRSSPSGAVKPKSTHDPNPTLAREEKIQALVFRWYPERKFGFIKHMHQKVMILSSSFKEKPTVDITDRWVEYLPSDVKLNEQAGRVNVLVRARLVTRGERRDARRKKEQKKK